MTYNHPPDPWKHIHPRPEQPRHTRGSVLWLPVAILLGVVVGLAIQQWRPSHLPLFGISSPTLERAERAFRNGNDQTAFQEFTKLADQNNPMAQYWLGHMTELGLGVARNPAKAIELYKKSAAKDNVAAELRLGEIYLNGDLMPPDFGLAKSYFEKAVHHGDARAAMLLGQMYRLGLGTGIDLKEAYAWSEVATLEGSTFARRERDGSLQELNADDQKAAIARATSILAEINQAKPSPQASPS
jgi:TPR repeat protein